MQEKSIPCAAISSTDEGIQQGDELHAEDCPCAPCKTYRARFLPEVAACPGVADCQGCAACPTVPLALYITTVDELADDLERHQSAQLRRLYEGWAKAELKEHTRPISLSLAPKRPAALVRSDGETLLYAGEVNSVYGEPSIGKSWIAVAVLIENLKAGVRVCYWDFEDRPSTLAERLAAFDAFGLADSPNVLYAVPSLAEDEAAMDSMARWLMGGDKPGFMILDSATQAGAPIDGAAPTEWYAKHVDHWKLAGIGSLIVDHVPKQKIDRPRGPVGSYQKLSRITGAALYVSGRPWTKTEDGMIKIRNDKDRGGDLPGPLLATVAILTGKHVDGKLVYAFEPPEQEDDNDLAATLLEAIAALGADGVSSKRGVRQLVQGKGKNIDLALDELVDSGLIIQTKKGKRHHFVAAEYA